MKNSYWWLIILILVLTFVAMIQIKKNWNDDDIRLTTINNSGIYIKTVSWQRRMVNELLISPEVQIWIPNGMGWYKAGDLTKILKQENNPKLANDILFFNFGYVPNMAIVMGIEENLGWLNDIRYFLNKDQMMIKKETIFDSLTESKDVLDEVLPRDFADNKILREDIRVTIYNLGQSNGLANFVASFLERAGITIVGVDTLDNADKTKICQINYGPKTITSEVGKLINNNLKGCEVTNDEGLNQGEIELYFGDGYSKMINYQSYLNNSM